MAIRTPKELFVLLLSHARQGTERSAAAYDELSEVAQHPEIKEALEARAFVANQTLERLDQVFKMIGEKPITVTGRLQEIFVEDLRKELSEIQSPEAKRLYVLAKLGHLGRKVGFWPHVLTWPAGGSPISCSHTPRTESGPPATQSTPSQPPAYFSRFGSELLTGFGHIRPPVLVLWTAFCRFARRHCGL